jgi:hypothetical protein
MSKSKRTVKGTSHLTPTTAIAECQLPIIVPPTAHANTERSKSKKKKSKRDHAKSTQLAQMEDEKTVKQNE